jgi:DUF971 family protein
MANQPTFNLKNSLIALIATASLGGLTLGFAQEARSNGNQNLAQTQDTLIAAAASTQLNPTAGSGTPQGFTQQEWMNAAANVTVTDVSADTYTVKIEANDLVPNGLYTVWWIEDQLIGKAMGPAGGVPDNEVRADNNGNVSTTITVPANNEYDMMGMAYHADNQTHGQKPGKMGETTFRHLMGKFVKPNN